MIRENFLAPKVIWDMVQLYILAQLLLSGLAVACVFAFRKPAPKPAVAKKEDQILVP